MGWITTWKDPRESAADFLKRECLTWSLPADEQPESVASAEGPGCLAFAVRFSVAFLARHLRLAEVFLPDAEGSVTTAILFLIEGGGGGGGYNFSYKDIDEVAGPNAPVAASILRYLSPLNVKTGGDSAKWAEAWRDRCRAFTNRQVRARLRDAATLFNCCPAFAEPGWSQFSRIEIGGSRLERRGPNDYWTVTASGRAEASFWTVYGRRKADPDGFAEREPITDCATRAIAHEIARVLGSRAELPIFDLTANTEGASSQQKETL